jgi:V8-like Glu-specific endopeptidase
MGQLHRRLNSSIVDIAIGSPLDVVVTPEERQSVSSGDTVEMKMKVGVVKELDIPMVFDRSMFSANRTQFHDTLGAVRGGTRGGFDWTARVHSSDATALRVHFTDFDLPEGAALYVYTLDGVAFGPYSGKGPNGTGDFWTNTVPGEDVIVQMHAGPSGTPSFRIAGIGYLTDEFAIAGSIAPPSELSASKFCPFNADCVIGAACTNVSAVSQARDAVASMLFPSGAYLYICSGGLVADSAGSRTPYFLTANHCISRSSEASGLETYFFYESSTCGSLSNCPYPGTQNTTGSTILSSNRTSDYTLLRLSQPAPSAAAFLGWNSSPVANTHGVKLYRISHPGGAPQAYSQHDVDTTKGTCTSWPRGNWIYSRDIVGATEGGSSGSPVLNGSGQIVGQLSGACGFNVNDNCDAVSNATVDGAFAAYYSSVSSILGSSTPDPDPDPDPTCTDADGDGYCSTATGGTDCNDNDSTINPGRHEKGKFGRDGKDNDCNGVIDG